MVPEKAIHLAIDGVGARFGGAATVLKDVVSAALSSNGVGQITVFTNPSQELDFELCKSSRLRKIVVKRQGYFSRVNWLLYGLKKALKDVKPDVLLCLGNGGVALKGIPAAVFIQQSVPFSSEALAYFGLAEKTRFLAIREIMKISCKRANKVLVQSPTMKNWVCRYLGIPSEMISVFPPSIQSVGEVDLNSPELRPMHCGPVESKVLYVGNTRPYKNLPCLLEAIANLRCQGRDIRLYLTCSPSHPCCRHPGVVGLGTLNKRTLWAAYQLADLLVMPSLVETVGLPMLEAASVGLPVIASDLPYAHDTLGDGAIYFDANDPYDLAEKMGALLSNNGLRRKVATLGKRFVAKRNENRPYERMIESLLSLTKSKKP
jgi:glycosyltransferase involved in cell wall biosynthesis